MSFTWHEIREHLMQSTNSLSFQRDFDLIRRDQPRLARFCDPAALLGFLHDGKGDQEKKNLILVSLVETAQLQSRRGDHAVTLMHLALWPGLDAVHGRLRRYYRGRSDELVSEIVARISIGVRSMDLTRVNKIAATLIRNVERDIKRALARSRAETAVSVPFLDDILIDSVGVTVDEPDDPDAASARVFEHLDRAVGGDAGLVFAVAVQGHSQRAAGEMLGIGHDAARKRYQRALERLRRTPMDLLQ